MTRIVVLGAKPHAVVPPGDAIYCANAAALTNPAAVAAFAHRSVVASGAVVARALSGGVAEGSLDHLRARSILTFEGQEALFFIDDSSPRLPVLHQELAKCGPPERRVQFLDSAFHKALVREFAGSHILADRRFLQQPVMTMLRDATRIGLHELKWVAGVRQPELPSKVRPSTGILALLLAIRAHGPDAQYVLSGVGLGNRDIYNFGGDTFEVKRRQRRALPRHVVADNIVLGRLAKHFNVCTTEPELECLLPLMTA
jgi:hypothetical protein